MLTEIDVAATLKSKLGVEFPACRTLGACIPQLARTQSEARRHIAPGLGSKDISR